MNAPLVSVIIPTFNRSHLLDKAVQSVLRQTYKNYEILVIDDHSPDETRAVVGRMNSEKIIYIRLPHNRGLSAARNTGFKAARGEFMALLDDDDEWLETKLEKQMEAFLSAPPLVGVVYTGAWKISNNSRCPVPGSGAIPQEKNIYQDMLQGKYFVLPSASMIRRECLQRVGLYDEHIRSLEDWDFWIRISKYYFFKYVDENLVLYHSTEGSLSRARLLRFRMARYIMKKHFRDIKKNPRALLNFCGSMSRLWVGHVLFKAGLLE